MLHLCHQFKTKIKIESYKFRSTLASLELGAIPTHLQKVDVVVVLLLGLLTQETHFLINLLEGFLLHLYLTRPPPPFCSFEASSAHAAHGPPRGAEILEILVAGARRTFRFDLHELLFDLIRLVDLVVALSLNLGSQILHLYPRKVVRRFNYLPLLHFHSFLVELVPSLLPPSPFLQDGFFAFEEIVPLFDIFASALMVLHEDISEVLDDLMGIAFLLDLTEFDID